MKNKVIKTVKSKKDLQEFALSEGAEIADQSGKKFNSGGEPAKKSVFSKALSERPPKPLEPLKPSVDAEFLAETVKGESASTRDILIGLQKQIAAIQLNAVEPITDWVFDVIRSNDAAMSIKRITAKGNTTKRVIN